ncbi:glycosyltransferase family 1 protein [Acinetobacter indicus]|uniref:glycosyltransferase n=1 Tax=Acinetobacter indicus TaxID=756892 RepID=UPI0013B09232|nr:glycosyltransferase [Acinetobacter indicus]QIC74739.1 glycosyltransferase family 1 protein [Acinetobacter indicus]
MKPIRVLHIIGKMDRAGAETMLMNLYRNINRSRVQFDFITFTNDKGDYDDEILALGGKIIPIIASNSLGRMTKLYQFLKSHPEYQTIHSHVLLNNAFHLAAASLADVNIRISHSHNTSNGGSNALTRTYEILAKLVINKLATHKIACGYEAGQYLYNDDKNVLVLPNAVDVRQIHRIVEVSRKSPNELFDKDKLNIIHVARFMPVKNHRFVLDIAEALIEEQAKFVIYLVGDGPLRAHIEQQIQARNLSEYIKVLGLRANVVELMANADVMILPSLHEGFPVVLVESQAVGLPTLVADTVAEEVDLGLDLVNFIPLDNARDWALKLLSRDKKIVSNEKILEKLSNLGFDVSQNARLLEKIYIA